MKNEIKIGDKVKTPRFLTVRIAAMFESQVLAESCGFTEPTHYENEFYEIHGKSIGNNRMLFCAIVKS